MAYEKLCSVFSEISSVNVKIDKNKWFSDLELGS